MFLLNCYVDIALMLVSVCNEMITNVMNEITCAMMRYVIFSSFLVFVSHFFKNSNSLKIYNVVIFYL